MKKPQPKEKKQSPHPSKIIQKERRKATNTRRKNKKKEHLDNSKPKTFQVQCPQCQNIQVYSPRSEKTVLKNARFKCHKCKKQSIRVLANKVILYKEVPKVSKKKMEEIKKENKKKYNQTYQNKKKEKNGDDILPLPENFMSFEHFCRWFSEPAYRGLYQWQKEHHEKTWGNQKNEHECEGFNQFEMTLVSRDHGKSIVYNNKYQWAMQYCNYDVLLLGWTERRKQVALYVYNFFAHHDLIETDKRTSPFHFRIRNGGRFDCFLITSKETLGMHSEGEMNRFEDLSEAEWEEFTSLFDGKESDIEREFSAQEIKEYVESRISIDRKLWISIDDPIDISFMKERHKEESLELKFQSQLYSINPDKWSFTGTHKFEGDFFDFIKDTFGDKLVIYQSGPFRKDGSLLCPERFTHPKLSTYDVDVLPYRAIQDPHTREIKPIFNEVGEKIKKIPKKDLAAIRKHVKEYAWHSEYLQDPKVIEGEIFKKIHFFNHLDEPVNRNYDYAFITLDRATTVKTTSDLTGYVIGLRHARTGKRQIIDDKSGNIPIFDLFHDVNMYAIDFRKRYEEVILLLVYETQGGGNDFESLVIGTSEYIYEGKMYMNKIREICILHPVHNTDDKQSRIKNRLIAPTTNGLIEFISSLRNCESVSELKNYPNSPFVDSIDALANAEHELYEYPLQSEQSGIKAVKRAYQEGVSKMKQRQDREPNILDIEQGKKREIAISFKKKRETIFG
jgi:hypothetical protein